MEWIRQFQTEPISQLPRMPTWLPCSTTSLPTSIVTCTQGLLRQYEGALQVYTPLSHPNKKLISREGIITTGVSSRAGDGKLHFGECNCFPMILISVCPQQLQDHCVQCNGRYQDLICKNWVSKTGLIMGIISVIILFIIIFNVKPPQSLSSS